MSDPVDIFSRKKPAHRPQEDGPPSREPDFSLHGWYDEGGEVEWTRVDGLEFSRKSVHVLVDTLFISAHDGQIHNPDRLVFLHFVFADGNACSLSSLHLWEKLNVNADHWGRARVRNIIQHFREMMGRRRKKGKLDTPPGEAVS